MKVNKPFRLLPLIALLALTGCGKGGESGVISASLSGEEKTSVDGDGRQLVEMSYYDETEYDENGDVIFNDNLFYRNDLVSTIPQVPDPMVLEITDKNDPDYGKFYLYGTTSSGGFQTYRTEDFAHWEPMGWCLHPASGTAQARTLSADCWAPECVYDEKEKMYYFFCSASPKDSGLKYLPFIAKGPTPRGPFELIDHSDKYLNWDGTALTGADDQYFLRYATFDPYEMWIAMSNAVYINDQTVAQCETSNHIMRAIDFHPFVDDDGTKYLFFTCNKWNGQTFVMAMKMNTWDDPDYDTLTVISRTRLESAESEKQMPYENGNRINEGSFVVKHNGLYYLTLSINGYGDRSYCVIQSVSDKPLGVYRKLDPLENGVLLSTDSQTRDDISGPGHHSFIHKNGRSYIIYHKHNDVQAGGAARHVSVDELHWVTIKDIYGEDLDVMVVNGPSKSIQPKFEFVTGYRNVAVDAKVTATNISEGSSAKWLNDDLISYYVTDQKEFYDEYVQETKFDAATDITMTFDDPKTVRALMVYNSNHMDSAFASVKRVEFDCKLGDGTVVTKFIDNLKFDLEAATSEDDVDIIRPGHAAIAEFNEIEVKEVRIKVEPATEEEISIHGYDDDFAELQIPEIRLLGK